MVLRKLPASFVEPLGEAKSREKLQAIDLLFGSDPGSHIAWLELVIRDEAIPVGLSLQRAVDLGPLLAFDTRSRDRSISGSRRGPNSRVAISRLRIRIPSANTRG